MTRASWTVLVETKQADGTTERIEVAALERDVSSPPPNDLGLRLAEAKDLLLRLQSFFAQDQVRQMSAVDQTCRCGSRRRLHDYRTRQVDTLFGRVILRQPRWRSCGCDRTEAFGAVFTTEPNWAILWISITLGGLAAAAPVGWSIPSLISPKGGTGTVGGIMNFVNNLMGVVAPVTTGYVVGLTNSFSGAFLIAGVVLLIGIFSYIVLLGRIEPLRQA